MEFSNRIAKMQESPIRKLAPLNVKAKKEGKQVYYLNIGQPDIETPVHFINAIKNFDEKILKYTASQGIPELINAISGYYSHYNMDFKEDNILITNGGSEAVLFSLIAIADPDDEILMPEPFYTNFQGIASSIGVKVKAITTHASDGFRLPGKEKIEALIGPKTKAILFSHPGNPTGVVYTDDEIRMLADIAKEHNLYIISDEVYREFVYDGLSFTSFGTVRDVEDRVIIIDSISKRFSACGTRIGAILSKNTQLIQHILKLCQGRLCCPTLEQVGATALYGVSFDYFDGIKEEYQKRRDAIYEELIKIPGVKCEKPRGAFYIIAKLPVIDAEKFAMWLLSNYSYNNETVMLAPAQGFYCTDELGKDEVRIAYVLNEYDIRKAMKILKLALQEYSQSFPLEMSEVGSRDISLLNKCV